MDGNVIEVVKELGNKLVAGLSVYNEEKKIKDCLLSLVNVVDKVVIVDGMIYNMQIQERCYNTIQKLTPNSYDSTLNIAREILERAGIPYIIEKCLEYVCSCGSIISLPYFHEVQKRNIILENVEDGDWVLIIDADERLKGPANVNLSNHIKEQLKEIEKLGGESAIIDVIKASKMDDVFPAVRFFLKTPTLHYCRNHYSVCKIVNGKHKDMIATKFKVDGVWLLHEPD